MDSEIQRIIEELDRLGILDVRAIVITADHGEGLGVHGIWGHGLPYQDTAHIPLPQIRGADAGREFALTEVRRGPKDPGYRALMADGWKYMETLTGKRELYNLAQGPLEKVNLVARQHGVAASMAAKLAGWKTAHLGPDQADPMLVWPLPESQEQG